MTKLQEIVFAIVYAAVLAWRKGNDDYESTIREVGDGKQDRILAGGRELVRRLRDKEGHPGSGPTAPTGGPGRP